MIVESNGTRLTDMLRVELSDAVRETVGRALAWIPNPEDDCDGAMIIAYKAFAQLPDKQLRLLLDFGRHVEVPGVALVDNLPVDPDLPPTPSNGGPCVGKPCHISEGVLIGLSGLLGEPVSFTTEKQGRIVHDIIPTESGAMTQTSQSSSVFLSFHNDIVHDARGRYDVSNPDFLVLNCLRADPDGMAETSYADARDILAALDAEVVETLRSPQFRLNAPGGYTRMYADGHEVLSEPVPLIDGPDHAPEIYVAANGVRMLSAEAEHAFAELQRVCRDPRVGQVVTLRAGQALLINNRKGVHSRTPFPARYDGTDRWLQRTYIRRSLWNIRDQVVPGSRRTHR